MKQLPLIVLLLLSLAAHAQTSDFGTELEASATFKLTKGTELTLSEELRMKDNSHRYAKSETSAALQYALLRKPLKQYDMRWRIGGGYSFINRQNSEYRFSSQHRLMVQTSLSKDWSSWRLSARMRYQSTWRNPAAGSFQVNPQQYLRLRLSARYSPAATPWQLTLSEEVFCRIADPRGSLIDESRTQLSATYDLNKHHSITLYGKIAQELQVANPGRFFALGISYDFQ